MSFGDIRVAERADWLIERVATAGTLVLRRLGESRAGEKAIHRFLSSPYVSVERIVETLASRTAVQCSGPTEINFLGRDCQSAFKFDPSSASNFDPFERRGLTVALGSSELAGIAETRRARVA